MRRLYIDFDGVVLDDIPPLYEKLGIDKGGIDNGSAEEKIQKFANFDYSEVVNDKYILNDSINCIKKLLKSKKFEISFLSHVHSLDEAIVKVKYLRRHFKDDITIIIVPGKISKTKMVHSEGAILVDDFSSNLREWREAGGIPVRFNNELESKGFKVINRLDALLDMFDEDGNEIC
ncbi:MAG: hypothetical protein IJK67_01935 [Bacilli bacterium]|nr:hypothetical protein [Bacilli bacterium]